MDFTDLQMTATVVLVLTAAAVAVFVDQRRKQRHQRQAQRIKSHTHSAARTRPIQLFDTTPLEYAPAKKLAAERPLEPLVATATASRPPVQMRERETVTIQMAPPSQTPSPAMEFQSPGGMLPPITIDAILWERLIASQPRHSLLSAPEDKSVATNTLGAAPRMIQEKDAARPNPGGMIQQPALEEMLQCNEPFTGLVVSIGINDSDSSMWHRPGSVQSVGNYITSLLKEKDFACRTSYDEFVLVCWGEQGAQSQRRLNNISERLWDYQLRGMGPCSILFSWGGVQVQDRPLAEAIASATERMRETKRSGKSALAQRKAV
jgi:hypothetical protein